MTRSEIVGVISEVDHEISTEVDHELSNLNINEVTKKPEWTEVVHKKKKGSKKRASDTKSGQPSLDTRYYNWLRLPSTISQDEIEDRYHDLEKTLREANLPTADQENQSWRSQL
jgi:hypothetical protein